MRVLVTGGAGYIGSHAVKALVESGEQVFVLDDLSNGHREAVDPKAHFVRLNIADDQKLLEFLKQNQIEAVMHFAAFIEVAESVKDPFKYYENNFTRAIKLLKACLEASVRRFVFSSTAAVYGNPIEVPISEEHSTLPINPYGRSKRMLEIALEDICSQSDLNATVFRYFNVAGAHESGDIGEDHHPESHLIPNILKSAQDKAKEFSIFGTDYPTKDGTCIRDYVHVQDLVEAHILALKKNSDKSFEVYNLGSQSGYSVREVFEACERVLGQKLAFVERPRREGDPAFLVASSERARRELGWKPSRQSLDRIIEDAWRWHQKHPKGFQS